LICLLSILHWVVLYFKKHDVVDGKGAKRFTLIRFTLTFLLSGGCCVFLFLMFNSTETKYVDYLAANACSDDPILNASFV
jgi:hypothetical protein